MHLKYTFETMELGDQIVAVPVGDGAQEYRSVIRLNETGAEIFNMLIDETTEADIVSAMEATHGHDDCVADYVHDFLVGISAEGLLV